MADDATQRITRILEKVYAISALALLALGIPLSLTDKSVSLKYTLGTEAPIVLAALAPLVLIVLGRKRFPRLRVSRKYTWPVLAVGVAAGLWHGLGIKAHHVGIMYLLLLPGLVVFLWAWLYRSPNGFLVILPFHALGLVLFLTDLPLLTLGRGPTYHWATEHTFSYYYPLQPPYLGPGGRLRPDVNCRIWAPDHPLGGRFITNSVGFRNRREFEPEPDRGEIRIFNLGDSFSVGFAADQEAFFGTLLEKQLRRAEPGEEIHVINAEISDMPRAAYYFEKYGKQYEPRVVIYGLCGNDLEQSVAYCGANKLFRVGPDGRVEPNPAFDPQAPHPTVLYQNTAYPRARTTTDPLPTGPVQPPKKRSKFESIGGIVKRVYRFIRRFERFLIFQKAAVARAEREPVVLYTGAAEYEKRDGRKRLVDGYANLGFFYREPCPAVDAMYADFFPLLAALDRQVEDAGAQLVLVIFPQRFQVQPRDWEAMCEFWNLRPEDFDLELYNRKLRSFCREKGILCCDLLDAFRSAADRRPLYLPQGDMHFNTRGHEVAAEATAEFLLERDLW